MTRETRLSKHVVEALQHPAETLDKQPAQHTHQRKMLEKNNNLEEDSGMIRQAYQFRELLTMVGLAEREIDICIYLFLHGLCSLNMIASSIELPRSTIQYYLRALRRRGIIEISKQRFRTFYQIAPPENIFQTLQSRFERISIRMRKFQEMLKSTTEQKVH